MKAPDLEKLDGAVQKIASEIRLNRGENFVRENLNNLVLLTLTAVLDRLSPYSKVGHCYLQVEAMREEMLSLQASKRTNFQETKK